VVTQKVLGRGEEVQTKGHGGLLSMGLKRRGFHWENKVETVSLELPEV